MEQLGSHWTDFREVWYLSIFRKCAEKILNFIKICQEWGVLYMTTRAHLYDETCTFIWWHVHIYMMTRAHLLITCSRILLTKGNVSDKSRREILCSVTFSEYCTVYETVWKNVVDCVWNVMSHAQKPDFVFRRNGQVHLNRRGRQISRLLAAEVCASAVVMLDAPCS